MGQGCSTPDRRRSAVVRGGGTIVLAALALCACAYNPELGRKQLLIVGESGLTAAGEKAWADTLRTRHLSSDPDRNARVRAVGARVVAAAGLDGRPWDYVVLLDEAPNAFVLPGGHVGVTVGLMDLAANDDQLAAVIGHEAAHVVARHAAERRSQSTASRVLLAGAEAAAGSSSDLGRGLKAYGDDASRLAFLLPFSRQHELEADRLGVDYMQRAGYRPREAAVLWRRMQAQGGAGGPQFLSTHPSDATRIAALEAYLTRRGW